MTIILPSGIVWSVPQHWTTNKLSKWLSTNHPGKTLRAVNSRYTLIGEK